MNSRSSFVTTRLGPTVPMPFDFSWPIASSSALRASSSLSATSARVVEPYELRVPPLRLAALQRALRTRDVRGQLSLLAAELFFELGERLLPRFELVETQLVVGLVPSLEAEEVLLAVGDLADALSEV